MSYQSVNPSTGKRVKSFEHMSTGQLEHALATAQTCFQSWKTTPQAERAAVLSRAAVLLRAHVDDFAKRETLETGKRIDEARIKGVALTSSVEARRSIAARAGQTCCAAKRFIVQEGIADKFIDEFFGPVASFSRVEDEAEAIALANNSDFGLGGSVFTKDVARGERIASQVDTGRMFINNIHWSDAELPFGGIKNSGFGRELGHLGLQEFVNRKLVRTGDFHAPV